MIRALALAQQARGRTSPNPLVGAVIVNGGKIVGEGYHQKAGGPHAEIHALQSAGANAKGGTLYVNLEPCCHTGRTPPCTEAIINAGINCIYAAHLDPNPIVSGKGIKQLAAAGIEVNVGLCAEAAEKLNEVFIKQMTTDYPFVILKIAMSLDGKIATSTGESEWITSPASRQKVHELRDEVDAIIVGIGTVLTDNPALTTRLPNKKGKDATRIVLDSHARTPTSAKIFNPESEADVILAVTPLAFASNIALLKVTGAEILEIPAKDGKVCIKTLMETLGARGITSVMIEGGGEVNSSALLSGIVDKVVCFVAPKFIGGKEAPGVFGAEGIEQLSDAPELKRRTITELDGDILIEGYFDNHVHRDN